MMADTNCQSTKKQKNRRGDKCLDKEEKKMTEENVFNEISSDEFAQDDETLEEMPTPNNNDEQEINDEQEMLPDDFTSYTYLKNPDVGESVLLEVAKIVKKPGRELKNKTNGQSFWTGLKDKNDKRTETIIETVNNERFGISSWGLYFALFGRDTEFQKLAKKNGSYNGIKLKITHNYNGKDATANVNDLMKLRGFATIEEAEKHKQTVGKAMKEGKIYTVEIVQ